MLDIPYTVTEFCSELLKMNIYIDESGVFLSANHDDAWSVVAAYMSPEPDKRKLDSLLLKLRVSSGKIYKNEVKLKDLTEAQYIDFLKSLSKLKGALFAVATDMSMITSAEVIGHRDGQAEKVAEHKDKMRYEAGAKGLEALSVQIKGLSPQLYMQLTCQVRLLAEVLNKGILYFVQRQPNSLASFKWRVDQKNTSKVEYEKAFQSIAPVLLQTFSLNHQMIMLSDCDYSAMKEYFFTEEDKPDYLREDYGINVDANGALNIGKILNKNFEFLDSKNCNGLQVVDLLVSGLRRALIGAFKNNSEISLLLGGLFIQDARHDTPITLLSFNGGEVKSKVTVSCLKAFTKQARRLLTIT